MKVSSSTISPICFKSNEKKEKNSVDSQDNIKKIGNAALFLTLTSGTSYMCTKQYKNVSKISIIATSALFSGAFMGLMSYSDKMNENFFKFIDNIFTKKKKD